jgi:hypothetical protein
MSSKLKPDGVANHGCEHTAEDRGQEIEAAGADEGACRKQQRDRWQGHGALLRQYPQKKQSVAMPLDKFEGANDFEMIKQRSVP